MSIQIHLEEEVSRSGVEGEFDAERVQDVAGEERQPADQEGGWRDLYFIFAGMFLKKCEGQMCISRPCYKFERGSA